MEKEVKEKEKEAVEKEKEVKEKEERERITVLANPTLTQLFDTSNF